MPIEATPSVQTKPVVTDTSEPVIETRNLSKTYRDFWGRQKVRALKALDLRIYRGEIFGLLGPNGSGKIDHHQAAAGAAVPHERRRPSSSAKTPPTSPRTSASAICRKSRICTGS